MDLEVLPGRYAVCRLQPEAVQPIWARQPSGLELLSVTWSENELSVVCPEERVPNGTPSERSFTAMRVRGTLDLTLTGILHSLTTPLNLERVPVFAISTHDTDYLLLRVEDVERGVAALLAAGHRIAPVGRTEDWHELLGIQGSPVTRAAPPPPDRATAV